MCTEFVTGSPPPLAAAVLLILERPRHECDERLTSKQTTVLQKNREIDGVESRDMFLNLALTA